MLEPRPWVAEAKLGIPEGEAAGRPPNVVALEDVEGDFGGIAKRIGAAGGARKSGLNRIALPANEEGAPPHCHSADEEVFVVLDGEGTLELWPSPQAASNGVQREDVAVRAGHVIARPPGSRVGHAFRGGPGGVTMLIYGTRKPNDMAWFPRSNKIYWRGLGVIGRIEALDYMDGEPRE